MYIAWKGDYNGDIAKMNFNINNNEFVSLTMDNDDLKKLFAVQPVNMSIDKRLQMDYLQNNNNIQIPLHIKHNRNRKTSSYGRNISYKKHKKRTKKV